MYRFTPPNKYKHAYIFFNIAIIISIIVTAALFHDHIEIFGIPIALWWLFNGLRNKKALQKAGSHKEVKSHHENIVMAFIILSYFNKAIVSAISRYNCSLLSRVYEI